MFKASAVFVGEIDGIKTVALGESDNGSGRSVILQRGSLANNDDSQIGLDGYSLSTERGDTEYDALDEWSIADRTLALRLTVTAAARLGRDRVMEIVLPAAKVDEVQSGIEQLTGLRRRDIPQP